MQKFYIFVWKGQDFSLVSNLVGHLQGNLFEAARGGCWGLVLWLLLGLLALSVVTDWGLQHFSKFCKTHTECLVRQAFAGNSGSGKCAELLWPLRQIFNLEKRQCCKTVWAGRWRSIAYRDPCWRIYCAYGYIFHLPHPLASLSIRHSHSLWLKWYYTEVRTVQEGNSFSFQ